MDDNDEILERVKSLVTNSGIAYDEAYADETVSIVRDRVRLEAGISNLPALADSIIVDITYKLLRRRFYEGIESETNNETGSLTTKFIDNLFAEYANQISKLKNVDDDGDLEPCRCKVRFL